MSARSNRVSNIVLNSSIALRPRLTTNYTHPVMETHPRTYGIVVDAIIAANKDISRHIAITLLHLMASVVASVVVEEEEEAVTANSAGPVVTMAI